MPGGQKMIPQTDLLTHFYTNTAEGGQGMVPQTDHLIHFYANTMEGGKNDTPDYPPDSLPHKYRGR